MTNSRLLGATALFCGALLVAWFTHGTGIVKNDPERNISIPDRLTVPLQVQAAYKRSRDELSEILSAFEFFDQASIDLVKQHLVAGNNDPLESSHPFYVLIETSGSNKDHDDEKLTNYLEGLLTDDIVQDGVVAQDTTQFKNLWAIREGIPEACSKSGTVYKYDLSIPVPVFYQMVEDMRARLDKAGLLGKDKEVDCVVGFGHIGDGKQHLVVCFFVLNTVAFFFSY